MKRVVDLVINRRYFIAIVAFIIGVSLNLNGSSIATLNNYGLRENLSGKQVKTAEINNDLSLSEVAKLWIPSQNEDGTILGVPRLIRSDEWNVQTPFYISQARTGNKLINPTYALSGQNMVVAYNAPVLHPSVIGKPFNWGFLFLGAERGMSWYWCFKIIGFLLLAFEFSMILTKRKKYLSLVGSFWITFTPAVQWWFMQHLGDVVFFSLLIMVAVNHFFETQNKYKKLIMAILTMIGLIGFTLVIYPAFQVPFAYLLAIFLITAFVKAIRSRRIHWFDSFHIVLTVILATGIIGLTLYQSQDALKATLSTIYPGSRVSTGGTYPFKDTTNFLLNVLLPFRFPSYANQVELSAAFNFFGLITLTLPFVLKRKLIKNNSLGLMMWLLTALLSVYAVVGQVPEALAKVTFLSFVTSSRAWQAASVMGVFVAIWFIGYIWDHRDKFNFKHFVLPMVVYPTYLGWMVHENKDYLTYSVTPVYFVALIIILLLAYLFILYRRRYLFTLIMVPLVVVSGMTVNPVVKGIDVIKDRKLSQEVIKLVKEDSNALWMSDSSNLYNYVEMFGAHSIDGVRFYPDEKLMSKIDSSHEHEVIWNRYSHMRYTLTTDSTTMSNPAPDAVLINLNVNELDKLGIDYILTTRPLEQIFNDKFQKIYQDKDGNYIYQYNKK